MDDAENVPCGIFSKGPWPKGDLERRRCGLHITCRCSFCLESEESWPAENQNSCTPFFNCKPKIKVRKCNTTKERQEGNNKKLTQIKVL